MAASGFNGTHSDFRVSGPGVTTGRSGVLGKVFYVIDDFWPLNTSLWVKEFKLAGPAYAYHILGNLDFAIYNAGSAVPTLNRNHVHILPVVMPPRALVREFEKVAMPLFTLIKQNENQIQILVQTRDSILPGLLSGAIHVQPIGPNLQGAS